MHRSFQAAPHLVDLVYPTAVGFQHGLGVLKVWIDDMSQPVLTVPMNLAAFLDLEGGTAWVGFTASTGESHQNHEVLSWLFLESASEHARRARGRGRISRRNRTPYRGWRKGGRMRYSRGPGKGGVVAGAKSGTEEGTAPRGDRPSCVVSP